MLIDGAMESFEGCSSVSDPSGNILFYTNGAQVWNKQHVLMEGGTGLKGHESSTQSSLIVPRPYAPNQYYLFTTNALENGIANELAYSVVDMQGAEGAGTVTTKNAVLHQPVTEKLTAVKHANNRDTWLITHEWATNAFYAYLVNPEGVNSVPVVSYAGTRHSGGGGFPHNNGNAQGAMKASPDGNKLALAQTGSGIVELFDFDPFRGVVSNSTQIAVELPYGIEFSPDGNKLYVSTLGSVIYQFQATSCSPTTLVGTGTIVGKTGDIYLGSMQLGPDKKIYVARYKATSLGVIAFPDKLGTDCGFTPEGVSLSGRECSLGLPSFVQSSFVTSSIEVGNVCLGESTVFSVSTPGQADSVRWYVGDTPAQSYTGLSVVHTFSAAGVYPFRADVYFRGVLTSYCRSVSIAQPYSFSLVKDTTVCQEDTLVLDASASQGEYRWQDGSTSPTFSVTQPGTYWVEINSAGCTVRDSVQVDFAECPVFIPNVITPNGDEFNETFFIKGIKTGCEVHIYNRWGKIVYQAKEYKNNWSAPGLVNGVYYYLVKDVRRDKVYKGWLHVLR